MNGGLWKLAMVGSTPTFSTLRSNCLCEPLDLHRPLADYICLSIMIGWKTRRPQSRESRARAIVLSVRGEVVNAGVCKTLRRWFDPSRTV